MILNSLKYTRFVEIVTPAGKETGLIFLGKTFVADRTYNTLEQAINACRQEIDLGMAILITPSANQFRVWIAVPHQIIWEHPISQAA